MWDFFIQQARFTWLLIFLITVGGIFSALALPKEANPEVKVPYASVMTFYPGAGPQDVEELITEPIEEVVLNLEDLKKVTSTSAESMSLVFVEFNAEADIEDRVRALQDAVKSAESRLPEDAEDPVVKELNFSNTPILYISLSAEVPHTELKDMAETLQSRILELNGVSDVPIVGAREMEMKVTLDPKKLEKYGVSLFEVFGILQSADITSPLGNIELDQKKYSLRLNSELKPAEIGDLVLREVNGAYIYLRDLGEIKAELSEKVQFSRLSLEGSEPEEALTLQVYKKTGGDIITLVDEIYSTIDELKTKELEGATVVTTYDSAEAIKDQLGDLIESGLITVLLVGFVLLLTLGWREAIVSSLIVPLSFFLTFIGLLVMQSSINFLSLFSLILALGILVDTGIVIVVGMHVRLLKGESIRTVASSTVQEYKWPLISGTLTTVAAFVPMLFMTGIIGQFVKHIPITVSLSLMASLFVGLGLLPTIGATILKGGKEKTPWLERRFMSVRERYQIVLRWFLARRLRQTMLLTGMFFLFLASLLLPGLGLLKVVMFPPSDYDFYFIEVSLPTGSLLEKTDAITKKIESEILNTPEVASYVLNVGSAGNLTDGLGIDTGASSNSANFIVNLHSKREKTAIEIVEEYREAFAPITGAEIDVIGVSDGPPGAAPIDFNLFGEDFEVLKTLTDEAVQALESTEGVININSSMEDQAPEFMLRVNRERAQSLGLNPQSLAQLAAMGTSGLRATTLTWEGENVDVVLKTNAESDLQGILALPIQTMKGTYPLSYFVNLELGHVPASILHTDGDRTVNITAELEEDMVLNDVLEEFKGKFGTDFPQGYSVDYGGELEEQIESFQSLGTALIYGMLLILMILVLQFNSFKQSLIILLTVPLALIGVFAGLTLIQMAFSFPAFIGVVALTGIVVNNAIILIDRINKNIEEGLELNAAILDAGKSRFQPIILTGLTTVAGMIPLSMSDPTWGPLGFSIVFGLSFATILTLLVIPVAYQRLIKPKA